MTMDWLAIRRREAVNADPHGVFNTKLPAFHIRLLFLKPSTDYHAPIQCELKMLNLCHFTTYRTVSYTWGCQHLSECIEINGKSFWIRKNLDTLLRDLRRRGLEILWVDAICINQNDLHEKNKQILLMDHIYRDATETIVWLHEEIDTDGREVSTSKGAQFLSTSGLDEDISVAQVQRMTAAVIWLLQHPYWTRRWIIQELALSQDVSFISGEHMFHISALKGLTNPRYADQTSLSTGLFQRYGECRALRLCSLQSGDRRHATLTSLIEDYEESECTNPKDKVYALLSLCPRAKGQIKVDYKASCEALLIQVMDFVTAYEGLNPFKSTIFALDLSKALGIRHHQTSVTDVEWWLPNACNYETRLFFQTLLHHVADIAPPESQQPIHRLHSKVYGVLAHYKLRGYSHTALVEVTPQTRAPTDHAAGSSIYMELSRTHQFVRDISPRDLCPFFWKPRCSAPAAGCGVFVGFASMTVQPRHQIYALHGSRTALVVDDHHGAFRIVGRAVMFALATRDDNIDNEDLFRDDSGWARYCRGVEALYESPDGPSRRYVTATGAKMMSLLQLAEDVLVATPGGAT
jgi:hypothetical protein